MIWQVIYGKIPSKANRYKVITINGHGSLKTDNEIKRYELLFYVQCSEYRCRKISEKFCLYADVYVESKRQDLDNILKTILDCLQKSEAITNDNNCVKIVAEKFIDKKNPRIEFGIEIQQ